MREIGAFAFAQNCGAIAVEREAFGRIGEGELRVRMDGLRRGGGPELRGQHIAGYELIAHLGVEVGAQEFLLRDGFGLGGLELALVDRAERVAEFLEAGSDGVFGIVKQGEAAAMGWAPQVGPAVRRGGLRGVVCDAGGVPHIGNALAGGRGPEEGCAKRVPRFCNEGRRA